MEVLAAVNLVESGMGRNRWGFRGQCQGRCSSCPPPGRQAGFGKGDIRDPHDAIHAAGPVTWCAGVLERHPRKRLLGY